MHKWEYRISFYYADSGIVLENVIQLQSNSQLLVQEV